MKVINYNDILRKNVLKLFEKYDFNNKKDLCKAEKIYNDIRDNDNFKYLVEVMYICPFLINNFELKCNPYSEECEQNIEYFKSYNSIEEYTNCIDFQQFSFLCTDTFDFINSRFFDIRDYIAELKGENEEILKSICPLYINDIMYYMNTYGTDELINTYKYFLDADGVKKIAIEDTICDTIDSFNNLKNYNYYNFVYLITELLENNYKYNKYLLDNGMKIEKEEKDLISLAQKKGDEIITMISGNDYLLESLIRGYLTYELLDKKEKTSIDKYYDLDKPKKQLNKVKVKAIKLRDENN